MLTESAICIGTLGFATRKFMGMVICFMSCTAAEVECGKLATVIVVILGGPIPANGT